MPKKILIIGGTGMLGEPVARKLHQDGYDVRILSRNVDSAKEKFGETFEVVKGDIEDLQSLSNAMENCYGVHINLNGGPGPEDYDRVFNRGTLNIIDAAAKLGIQRLTMITGTSVAPENAWFYITKSKLKAEEAVIKSGIPYFIFRPSWFFESLPLFVRDGRASEVGKQKTPWRWLAVADYAQMVSKSYGLEDNLNKCLYIHGPELFTLKEALVRYCRVRHPEIKVSSVPIWLVSTIATLSGKAPMKDMVRMMAYFSKTPESGDPSEADRLLGKPLTTLDEWLKQF